jgi:glutamine synthetase
MAKTVADVMKHGEGNEVKFVDFRFTDTRGKEQHVSVPSLTSTKTSSFRATRSTAPRSPAGRASKRRTCC